MNVTAYIGIGSNQRNPLQQATSAIKSLNQLEQSRLLKVSPWYKSKAIGPGTQPDYINGVAALNTNLSPHGLLLALQKIESSQGRARTLHWGPRTLDLDILLYGNSVIAESDLVIPHPYLKERNFVLYPLADIAPELKLPDRSTLQKLLANVSVDGIVRLTAGD